MMSASVLPFQSSRVYDTDRSACCRLLIRCFSRAYPWALTVQLWATLTLKGTTHSFFSKKTLNATVRLRNIASVTYHDHPMNEDAFIRAERLLWNKSLFSSSSIWHCSHSARKRNMWPRGSYNFCDKNIFAPHSVNPSVSGLENFTLVYHICSRANQATVLSPPFPSEIIQLPLLFRSLYNGYGIGLNTAVCFRLITNFSKVFFFRRQLGIVSNNKKIISR